MSKIEVTDPVAEHMDNTGMVFSSVENGFVITITESMLQALLEKAQTNESGRVMIFVQSDNQNKA